MLNRKELQTIHDIAERAVALYQRLDMLDDSDARFALTGIASEIMTVHTEIIPLRLEELAGADDSNFAHDIGGIHRHLDKESDKPRLTDGFCPRFAVV